MVSPEFGGFTNSNFKPIEPLSSKVDLKLEINSVVPSARGPLSEIERIKKS